MNERRLIVSRDLSVRVVVAVITVFGLASVLVFDHFISARKVNSMDRQSIPNNLPHSNPGGKAATFSTQGAGPPAPPEVIADIVNFERSLSTAQLIVPGVGRLDSDGARGGPEALSTMDKVLGRLHQR